MGDKLYNYASIVYEIHDYESQKIKEAINFH